MAHALRDRARRRADPRFGTDTAALIGYAVLLILLVACYGLCARQRTTDPNPIAFLVILATVAVVFRVTDARPFVQHVAWAVLSVAAIATIVATLLGAEGQALDVVLSAASLLALLIAPARIIGHQATRRGLNVEALLAAITAYVLVGLFFAFMLNLLSLLSPAPIFDGAEGDSLANQVFFSFTTLTTTGYGNLVPVSTGAQTVAVTEAITGQFFLITAVARIMRGAGRPTTAPDVLHSPKEMP
ncbi:two pore domain potassium channel family protein [Microbacterium sp. SSW1-49]|uniref:Two pore domain potassium channel family protein n=2 Tax=Microbacterium croceum TaxID=2851645 RepID=A0ABT0FC57_9MICO|nr:two pore domain potassium channel family protein [Microbacterium croceum]